MKHKVIAGFLAAACFMQLHAQTKKTITVKSPYSKKVIYTLKKGETLQTAEAFISFNTNGTKYEFITIMNEKYYLHTNAGIEGPLSYEPHRLDEGRYIFYTKAPDSDKYQAFYYDANKKIKLGPYESVDVPSEYRDHHAFYATGGFVYSKDGMKYVKVFGLANDLGPYKSADPLKIEKGGVDFIFAKDSLNYRYQDGKIAGPYRELTRSYSYPLGDFIYRGNEGYFATINGKSFGPFKEKPQYTWEASSNKKLLYVKEANGIYSGYIILTDGTKVPSEDPNKRVSKIFELPDKSWVKLEKTEMIKAAKNGKVPYCHYSEPWTIIYSNGKSFGPFTINDYGGFTTVGNEVSFGIKDPPEQTCDPVSGKASSKNAGSQAYFFSNGEKISLNSSSNNFKFAHGKTKCGFVFDKKLYVGKEYTGINNVDVMNFDKESDDWYATAVSGGKDSAYLFRNGKKVFTANGTGVQIYSPEFSGNNFTCFYRVNEWYYLKLSNRSKDLGPFAGMPSWYHPLLLSKDKKHIGMIVDYTKVNIDGEDKGEGAALSLNETSNSFHWLSLEKQNVMLHSLKL